MVSGWARSKHWPLHSPPSSEATASALLGIPAGDDDVTSPFHVVSSNLAADTTGAANDQHCPIGHRSAPHGGEVRRS